MHVTLNPDRVKEQFSILAQAVEDVVIGRIGAVIVDEQRRLRFAARATFK